MKTRMYAAPAVKGLILLVAACELSTKLCHLMFCMEEDVLLLVEAGRARLKSSIPPANLNNN